jgi:Holliday junction resolvase RusA-like endonuclease
MLILAASLPLPVSVNRLHRHDPHNGRVRLADEALEYTDTVMNLLNYYGDDQDAFTPFEVAYLNTEAIARIRQLRGNPSRAKAVLSQHRFYRMDTLLVLAQDKGDLDNFHKILQDVLCNWLGFNDRRVIEIHSQRVVDKTVQPHVEVVIRETKRVWASGSLIDYVKTELSLTSKVEGESL